MCPEGDGSVPSEGKRFCGQCGREVSPQHNFCPSCGHAVSAAARAAAPPAPAYLPYVPPKVFGLRDLGRGLGSWGAFVLLLLTAVNVAILLWGMGLVYPHLDSHTTLYIIVPFIVPLFELGGDISFFLYYVALAAAITASFAWMIWRSRRSLAEELLLREPKEGHSPLYVIATIFMAVISFNIIFNLIVLLGGTTPNTPGFDDRELWGLLFGLAHASVWEEVVSRILLIGIPLLIVDLLIRTRDPRKRLNKPHRYFLGGGFAIGRKEAFFLALSSIIFGLAHVFAWDLWKVLPALVGGLAFGYLFLKLGVYASITLHFMIDYLSMSTDVFPDSTLVALVILLLTLLWAALGLPYLLRYGARAAGWFIGREVWPDVPRKARPAAAYPGTYQYPPGRPPQGSFPSSPPAPAQPPQYSWPPPAAPAPPERPQPSGPPDPTAIGYRCPHCGNAEAVYQDGQLKCTKCGRS